MSALLPRRFVHSSAPNVPGRLLTSVLFIIHSYEDAGYEKSDLRKVRLLRRVV